MIICVKVAVLTNAPPTPILFLQTLNKQFCTFMTKTLTIIFLLLVPTALCQWIEGMSTYIEPEFPPSG